MRLTRGEKADGYTQNTQVYYENHTVMHVASKYFEEMMLVRQVERKRDKQTRMQLIRRDTMKVSRQRQMRTSSAFVAFSCCIVNALWDEN